MDFLNNAYAKSHAHNEAQNFFWDEYLRRLKDLNLNVFSDNLKLKTLVPVGSRVFFRGNLIHTSEVTVALGGKYFAKCCLSQAQTLRKHRITNAETNLQALKKERDFLENQKSFREHNLFSADNGQDIIEPFVEEEESVWQVRHRENVRKFKKQQAELVSKTQKPDKDLWHRLDELELEEDLLDELKDCGITRRDEEVLKSSITKTLDRRTEIMNLKDNLDEVESQEYNSNHKTDESLNSNENSANMMDQHNTVMHNLYDQASSPSYTEEDVISRIEKLEKEELMEEELDRSEEDLDQSENEHEETRDHSLSDLKRAVSFADKFETIEILFSHSNVLPATEAFNAEKGVCKPSDIYEAYPDLLNTAKVTSILKKKQVRSETFVSLNDKIEPHKLDLKHSLLDYIDCVQDNPVPDRSSIVVKDVVDTNNCQKDLVSNNSRPLSLFKKRRNLLKNN